MLSYFIIWSLVLLDLTCSEPMRGLEGNVEIELKRSKRLSKDSACSALWPQCICRSRKHKEQSLVCLKKDCLEKLPADEIPDSHIREVVSLLVVRQRNLTRIGSEELRRLGNIRHIRIFRCSIREVANNAFIGLNHVERLDLHHNELTEVPKAIQYLRNLKFLNLGGNRISYIHQTAFYSNSVLEKLVLSRNTLTNMPDMLPPTLIKLSISKNMIENVGDLRTLINLKIFKADDNKLSELPTLPSSVKVVNMCWNKIARPISLKNLPNLKAVSMSNNPDIGNITISTFFDMNSRSRSSKLTTFKARNAGIRSIAADAFACLRRLQHVDISYNSISTYQPRWFTRNKGLRGVYLTRNPWSCNCDIKSNLLDILNTFTARRTLKNPRNESFFINDFLNETCSTKGGSSCEKFRLENEECMRPEPPPGDIVDLPISHQVSLDTITTARKVPITNTTTTTSTTTITSTASTTKRLITSAKTTISGPTPLLQHTTTDRLRTTKTANSIPHNSTRITTTTTAATPTEIQTTTRKPSTTTTQTTSNVPATTTSIRITTTSKASSITTTSKVVVPSLNTIKVSTATTTTQTTTTTPSEEWCLRDGRKCHFPFIYKGKEYYECVPSYRPWCSPTRDYDTDGEWDRCVICE
ncbi:uncharacterized protein LOC120342294 [Styela clava]